MSNENIWFFEEIDFYEIFCPHKYKALNNQEHCFLNFKKDQFIYQEDSKDNKVYLVKEGKVKIGHITEDGKELTKAILSKGDMFGEMAIMGETERRDFAQAIDSSTVICPLTIDQMEDMMKENRPFSLKVRRLIGLRLQRAERMVTNLLFKSSRTRIIEYLIYLAEEKGKKIGYEILVQDFHSHKIIANLTATSRQTVTTILNELRTNNLITFNRQRLLIRDLDKLRKEL
jgi:CRP/FNR family transcriptional regulator, cyclic AMP receptor protein